MDRKELRSIAGVSLAVTALYNLGFLSLFYAIPLQFAALRGSRRYFLSVSFLSALMILGIRYSLLRMADFSGLILLDIAVVAGVSVSFYIAHFVLYGYSVPVRLGILAAGAGIVLLAAGPLLSPWRVVMAASLDNAVQLFHTLSEQGQTGGAVALPDGESLIVMMRELFGRFAVAAFFFFLCFSWWSGCLLFQRLRRKRVLALAADWDFPDNGVWLLFAPLTLLLINRLFHRSGLNFLQGIPAYAVSNLLIIMSGLFGLKGLGIIRGFLRRWDVPRQWDLFFLLTVVMLAAVPGINLILLTIVAGLGVSGLWVNYRIFDKE